MALRKCGGCKKEIGAKAAVCPQCGEPGPKRTGSFTMFIAVAFAAVILWRVISGASDPVPSAATIAPVARQPTIDKSAQMQAGRKKIIGKLQQGGVFGEVSCRDSGATAIVRPAFYALDFEQKQSFAGVAYAWCFDGTRSYISVRLVDSKTNKAAGSFSAELGLKLE